MSESEANPGQRNGQITLFEVVPASASIWIGIALGQWIYDWSGSVVLGIAAGVVAVPIAFVVVAYGFAFLVAFPLIVVSRLLGRKHPRDQYFGDP